MLCAANSSSGLPVFSAEALGKGNCPQGTADLWGLLRAVCFNTWKKNQKPSSLSDLVTRFPYSQLDLGDIYEYCPKNESQVTSEVISCF